MLQKKQKKAKSGIGLDVVMHVAKLARLNMSRREAKSYQKDLNNILAAFRELKSIKAAVPSFHPLKVRDVLRPDAEEACLTREKALANTKHKEDGFFKGPRSV